MNLRASILLVLAPLTLVAQQARNSNTDWTTYGLTPGETRYSPLNQINASNVKRLGLAWSTEIGTGGGNQEGTPLMYNGVIYAASNWSVVFAIDARTGKEKWRWDPQVNHETSYPCCGVVTRGIAIHQNKIIVPIFDGRLLALDMETGRPIWETRVSYPIDGYAIPMAPRMAKNKIIVGTSGGEKGARGFFAAYDADTGRQAWKFYVVPGDPSKPFENTYMKKAAATWAGEWWKAGGGGSIWDGISYDPEADLVYIGTGNGAPWPQVLRQNGKGQDMDNLYVCSIIAVKPDTGEMKWYYQATPGDSWDFDAVQQMVLADITIKGKPRKVLMQANKNGFFLVLDRVTGQFISGAPFAKVNWAKGLDESTGRPIVNKEAYYDASETTLIYPSTGGAHTQQPMSFNPSTGLVYIPANLDGNGNMQVVPEFTPKIGGSSAGALAGGHAAVSEHARPTPPIIGPDVPAGVSRALEAWDPVTQKRVWLAPTGGGTLSTAGGLVFQSDNTTGRLRAYSADKGEKLLDIQTDVSVGLGPAITFELDGKQYIAMLGGTGAGGRAGGGGGAAAGGRAGAAAGRGGAQQGAFPPPAPEVEHTDDPTARVPQPRTANPRLMVFALDARPAAPTPAK